jgi:hypothetical protein
MRSYFFPSHGIKWLLNENIARQKSEDTKFIRLKFAETSEQI